MILECKKVGDFQVQNDIPFMEIIPANLEAQSCTAAFALKGRTIPIDQLPNLPLLECDAISCPCIWGAALKT